VKGIELVTNLKVAYHCSELERFQGRVHSEEVEDTQEERLRS